MTRSIRRDARAADRAPRTRRTARTVLRIGTLGRAERLDPRHPDAPLQSLMVFMEPLLRLTADLDLLPALATWWRVEDGGHTIRLGLRDGVVFHDGTPFGSGDVRYTLESLMPDALESVDAPGPLEAVVRFKAPSAGALYDLARVPVLPSAAAPDFADQPIGTGPYAVAAPVADGPLRVRRFDRHWGPRAHHDAVEVHAFEPGTLDALVDSLVDGALDLAQVPLSPAQVARIDRGGGVFVERIPSLDRHLVALNTAVDPLYDPRVRAAIDLLAPRELIAAGFVHEAFPVSTLLGERTPWSDGAPPRAFDAMRARDLLDDGAPIGRALRLHTEAEPTRVLAAARLRDELAHHGIPIEVVPNEAAELDDRVARGDYDLLLVGAPIACNPVAAAAWAVGARGRLPAPTFSTTRIAALADAIARQDVSHGAGAEALRELLGLLADEAAHVYIGAPAVHGAFCSDLAGWAPHPDPTLSLQDVHRILRP